MSQVYNLEPPTKGQVVLHTSHGDIEVELWPQEAPKAVRNFTQLCMEGYYDGTIFHRVIKEFMIQGGDPTGTGRGGESIYGRPFKNEIHSRLRFTHRGLVACANAGESDSSNGSQFFITTERADELTRKYTIFGRVSGETIFTVLRMQEVEVDDNDRPTDPPVVTSCDVLLPPFDDIVPRTTPAEKREKAAAAEQAKKLADIKKRKQQGKKLNVLSFGDEAEDEGDSGDEGMHALKYRSAHETLREDSKLQQAEVGVHDQHVEQLQQRLLAEQRDKAERDAAASAAAAALSTQNEEEDEDEERRAAKFAAAMRDKMRGRGAAAGPSGGGAGGAEDEPNGGDGGPGTAVGGAGGADAPQRDKIDKLKLTAQGKGAAAERKRQQEIPDAQLLTRFQRTLAEHRQRKRARGAQESDVLGKLRDFKSKMKAGRNWQPLKATKETQEADAAADTEKKGGELGQGGAAGTQGEGAAATDGTDAGGKPEAYNGKVNKDIDHRAYLPAAWRIDQYQEDSEGDEEDDRLSSLASHSIHWSAEDRVADPDARRENVDDYKVIDPLLEKGKAAFNKKQQHAKKRASEWAGRPNL